MIEQGTTVHHDFAIRSLTVTNRQEISPGFVRITVSGPELAGFVSTGATDHSKLFFADPATGTLTVPTVTPEGIKRPEHGTVISRDYTPRVFRDATEGSDAELDFDFLLHGEAGPASAWAAAATLGSTLVVGGPRGSREVPKGATRFILAADETALPALARWIESIPEGVDIISFVQLSNDFDAAYLEPAHVHRAKVIWLSKEVGSLERAIRNVGPMGDDTFVWAAGEATSLVPIRRYLRNELGLPKNQYKVDGYWKQGEPGRDHHLPIDPTDPED
ncbi:MAG: siderophore-interacting protein [Homoserinimonas sp.]|nr:siderophore-interacting protein [Homoserinimonas sp.]